MKLAYFIASRIAGKSSFTFSSFIIRISVISVALSLSVMIITSSMVNGFQHEIQTKVFGFWSHIQIAPYSFEKTIKQKAIYKNPTFYTQPSDKRIIKIQRAGSCGGLLNTRTDFAGIILRGADSDFYWSNFKGFMKGGEILHPAKEGESEPMLISENIAHALQIKLHDKVIVSFMTYPVRMKQFVVSGIYNSGLEEFDKQYVFVNMNVVQDQNGWGPDSVGEFDVFLDPSCVQPHKLKNYYMVLGSPFMSDDYYRSLLHDQLDEVAEQLNATVTDPGLAVETIKELKPNIFDWLYMQSSTEVIILFIMFLVAILNLCTALLILILERTNMIGILKAIGASNWTIQQIFLIQAGAIIAKGLAVGNILGIGICLIQKYGHIIKLPAESYYVTEAPVAIDLVWIIGLNIITFIVCILCLILPSMYITKISPVKSIRFN